MIVAEIGQNFLGDIELARHLIGLAKDNGADLVKFQLYDHKMLYGDQPDIQDVALSKEQAFELFEFGREIGIEVFFSVFDVERVKWCEEMGVKRYKIASSMSNDKNYVNAISKHGKPLYISTQDESYHVNFHTDIAPIYRLYCMPLYPAPLDSINFHALSNLEGFSDHTIGLDAAKIALARGATIIEKHFAIDHKTGVDAEWSMTPGELKELKRFEAIAREAL